MLAKNKKNRQVSWRINALSDCTSTEFHYIRMHWLHLDTIIVLSIYISVSLFRSFFPSIVFRDSSVIRLLSLTVPSARSNRWHLLSRRLCSPCVPLLFHFTSSTVCRSPLVRFLCSFSDCHANSPHYHRSRRCISDIIFPFWKVFPFRKNTKKTRNAVSMRRSHPERFMEHSVYLKYFAFIFFSIIHFSLINFYLLSYNWKYLAILR